MRYLRRYDLPAAGFALVVIGIAGVLGGGFLDYPPLVTIGLGVFIVGGLTGTLGTRYLEKYAWNDGICRASGLMWKNFDMDSQGGRGYKDAIGNTLWVSYNVDKYPKSGLNAIRFHPPGSDDYYTGVTEPHMFYTQKHLMEMPSVRYWSDIQLGYELQIYGSMLVAVKGTGDPKKGEGDRMEIIGYLDHVRGLDFHRREPPEKEPWNEN